MLYTLWQWLSAKNVDRSNKSICITGPVENQNDQNLDLSLDLSLSRSLSLSISLSLDLSLSLSISLYLSWSLDLSISLSYIYVMLFWGLWGGEFVEYITIYDNLYIS